MGFSQHYTDDDSPEAEQHEEATPTETEESEMEIDPSESPTVPMAHVPEAATREMSVENSLAHEGAHITFGYATDAGLRRGSNEDSLFAFFSSSRSVERMPDFGVFIVADGMGGHEFGEKASAIAVRIVTHEIMNAIYSPLLALADISDIPPMTDTLAKAVRDAGTEIYERAPRGDDGVIGTTCTAIMILGSRAFIAHVGDTRAYLISERDIEQLTVDHSVVEYLVQQGTITEEEAATHPRRHELRLALGTSDDVEPDISSRSLPPDCKLLICSDGLWNLVEDEDMFSIINTTRHPQDACEKLVALANTRGGDDNIRVVLLQVD